MASGETVYFSHLKPRWGLRCHSCDTERGREKKGHLCHLDGSFIFKRAEAVNALRAAAAGRAISSDQAAVLHKANAEIRVQEGEMEWLYFSSESETNGMVQN